MTRRCGVLGEARSVKPRLTSKPGCPGVGPLPYQSQGVSKTPGVCNLARNEGLNLRLGEQAPVR